MQTRRFPNPPNEPALPSAVLRPHRTVTSTTIFTFSP